MPGYQYTAKNSSGKVFKDVLEAENLDAFYRALKDRGLFCLTVSQIGGRSRNVSLSSGKIKLKELAVFCRQFSTMLSSGITVIKCLDILYQQTENRKMKARILGVYEAVQKGESLSRALKAQDGAFPPLLCNMVEAGESSGSLDVVMRRLADTFEKDNKLQNKVRQALVYPIFLIVLTLLVVIFLLTFILPRFVGMFNQLGGKIPLPTRILIGLSHGITSYWYIILAVTILVVFLWNRYINSKEGRLRWDKLKLSLPIAGKLLLKILSARFSRTLSALVSSGMPIIQALEIVGRVIGNRYLELKLFDVIEDVRRGLSLSVSLKRLNLFPLMLCSMVSVGEESGNLDEIMNKTSSFYDEESDAAVQRLISLIEPIMIVLLALIIGFIVISIIVPIYSIYQQINTAG